MDRGPRWAKGEAGVCELGFPFGICGGGRAQQKARGCDFEGNKVHGLQLREAHLAHTFGDERLSFFSLR